VPPDRGLHGVALLLPLRDVVAQRVVASDAAGQALPPRRAELDLGHVEPGAVLGRVVGFDAAGQALGRFGRERPVEAGERVGVALVHHQDHPLGLPIAAIEQVAHEARPVTAAAVLSDGDVPPSAERFAGQEQAGDPVAGVDIVRARHCAGPVGNGSRVSPTSCLKVSSRQTTGRFGS
jgi:hypothetical protein